MEGNNEGGGDRKKQNPTMEEIRRIIAKAVHDAKVSEQRTQEALHIHSLEQEHIRGKNVEIRVAYAVLKAYSVFCGRMGHHPSSHDREQEMQSIIHTAINTLGSEEDFFQESEKSPEEMAQVAHHVRKSILSSFEEIRRRAGSEREAAGFPDMKAGWESFSRILDEVLHHYVFKT